MYERVDGVIFGMTSKCNSMCPMCPRYDVGAKRLGVENPDVEINELYLSDFKVMFPPEFVSKLNNFYYCGNYGDPGVCRDVLESMKYLREHNKDMKIRMSTNGSMRKPEWWKELSDVVGPNSRITFCMDGLADTHGLYRIGTDFNRVMENMEGFLEGTGIAEWQYIVFKHNQHQLHTARQMAKDMGVIFRAVTTMRFDETGKFPVYDREGNFTHDLEPPTVDKFKNKTLIDKYTYEQDRVERPKEYEIVCDKLKINRIHVSFEGLVFPCFDVAAQYTTPYNNDMELQMIVDACGGPETISALHNPIMDIVKGEFFNHIKERWDTDPISICRKTCNVGKEIKDVNFIWDR